MSQSITHFKPPTIIRLHLELFLFQVCKILFYPQRDLYTRHIETNVIVKLIIIGFMNHSDIYFLEVISSLHFFSHTAQSLPEAATLKFEGTRFPRSNFGPIFIMILSSILAIYKLASDAKIFTVLLVLIPFLDLIAINLLNSSFRPHSKK